MMMTIPDETRETWREMLAADSRRRVADVELMAAFSARVAANPPAYRGPYFDDGLGFPGGRLEVGGWYELPSPFVTRRRALDPSTFVIKNGANIVRPQRPAIRPAFRPREPENLGRVLSLVTDPLHRHAPPRALPDPFIRGEAVAA